MGKHGSKMTKKLILFGVIHILEMKDQLILIYCTYVLKLISSKFRQSVYQAIMVVEKKDPKNVLQQCFTLQDIR